MVKKQKPPQSQKKSAPQSPLNKTDKRVWDTVKKTVKPLKTKQGENETAKMESLLSEYTDNDFNKKSSKKPHKTGIDKGSPLADSTFKQAVGDVLQKIAGNHPKFNPQSTIDALDDLQHGDVSQMHKSQGKRFLRGQLPIEARLDLHGMTQDVAHRSLSTFIEQSHRRGLRKVIVVTGKGQGILKNQTPKWLNDPILRRFILSFSYAQPRDGGDGALYVLLRKNR